MSRIKMSFSLIFAIFLVGILSTAVFASSAYGVSVTPDNNSGFNFSFTKISTDTQTAFTLNVYPVDPTTQTVSTTSVFSNNFTSVDTSLQSVDVTSTYVKVGTVYDFVLTHTQGGDVVGEKLGVLTSSSNLKMANVTDLTANGNTKITYTKPDGNTVTLDVHGTGLANVNHTGMGKIAVSGQKVHGFYQNNTDSCASCHQTHTASDNNLLMKSGAYSTCSSCHDGTTGAYNAFAPSSASDANSIDGTFNVSFDSTHKGSIHDSDGSLKVSAAPGGNHNPSGSNLFGSSFDCTSCHNPHGGGSASENNLSEDPLGWGAVQYQSLPTSGTPTSAQLDAANGKLYITPTIYTPTTIPSTKGAPYIFVLNTQGLTQDQINANFFYSRANVPANTPILQTYIWGKGTSGDAYVPDYSLWLQEKGYPNKADTVLKDVSGNDITRNSDVTVVWKDGFAYGSGVAHVVSTGTQISLGIDVETTPYVQTLYQTDFSKTDVKYNTSTGTTSSITYTYIPDSGVEMSKFCASCHIDYLSVTRKDTTGTYSTAHRHMTLADETNCVRCHYAHGSDASIMHNSNDQTVSSNPNNPVTSQLSYYTDINSSSALKRYTGMSVCYACHGQGEQFMSNPNNINTPLGGQPGDYGRIVEFGDISKGAWGTITSGYNVGFNLINTTQAHNLSKVVVDMYGYTSSGTSVLLEENTSTGLLTDYPNATSLSSPFDTNGAYTDNDWGYVYHWGQYQGAKPYKVDLTITTTAGDVFTIEQGITQ